jgi:Arc/MetJ-type ribon-helix-helix transcriptional regulator
MVDEEKSEVVTVRFPPSLRERLEEWRDRHGYSSEADAVRAMVRAVTTSEAVVDEMNARDDVMKRLDEIEAKIEEADNRSILDRLFS